MVVKKWPIYILVGCSGETGSTAIHQVTSWMLEDPCARETIELCIITFWDDAWQAAKLCPLEAFSVPILDPAPNNGGAAFGAALSILRAAIARDVLKPTTEFSKSHLQPFVLVVTDSEPCDDWQNAFEKLRIQSARVPHHFLMLFVGPELPASYASAQFPVMQLAKSELIDAVRYFFMPHFDDGIEDPAGGGPHWECLGTGLIDWPRNSRRIAYRSSCSQSMDQHSQ